MAGQNHCVIKIKTQHDNDKWFLGLNFMRNFYSIFDYENKQVGLAKSRLYGGTAMDATDFYGHLLV